MLDFQKDFVKFRGVLVIVVLLVFQDCDFAEGIEVNSKSIIFDNKACLVKDTATNSTLDLSKFEIVERKFESATGNISMSFNLCGKLAGGCGTELNSSACLSIGKKDFVLGLEGEYGFQADNGKISYKFPKGEKCSNDREFSLRLVIECGTDDQLKYNFLKDDSDNCSMIVSIESKDSCFKSPSTTLAPPTSTKKPDVTPKPTQSPSPASKVIDNSNCVIKGPSNEQYNLKQLQHTSHKNVITGNWNFTVQICRQSEVQIANCTAGTSICGFDGKEYKSYGKSSNLTYDKEQGLVMEFNSDVQCGDNKNYSSTILFICNTGDGKPEVTVKGCRIIFEWRTKYACNPKPCEGVHAESGVRFDMNPLKTKFNLTAAQPGKVYNFAICFSPGSPCTDSDGSCMMENNTKTSMGKVNDILHVNEFGSPYLLYEDGDKCSSNPSVNWTTKIEFVCANDSHITLQPTIIENSNCQLLIHYTTPLACQKQIKCVADGYNSGKEEIDLSILMLTNKKNYEIAGEDGKKFFLNVCRPLVSSYGLGCPGGSAACMTSYSNKSLPENEMSLGYPDTELRATGEQRAELKYLNGSDCPNEKGKKLSAIIEFKCDVRAGRGNAALDKSGTQKCEYRFVWKTNVICPSQNCDFKADSCEIFNKPLNISYNLKEFRIVDQNGQIKSKEVHLDICDGKEGKFVNVIANYAYKYVQINLNYDKKSNKTNTELKLICEENDDDIGVVTKHEQGYYLYKYETPTICSFLGMKVNRSIAMVPDNDYGTSVSGTFAWILGTAFIAASVFFVLRTPERREKVLGIFRRGYNSLRYRRVETSSNENSNLLLNFRPRPLDESDDDPIL